MEKKIISLGRYRLTIFLPDCKEGGVIYIPMHGDAQGVWDALIEKRAALVSVEGFDWNRNLSPWPAKAVFGEEDFGGQADVFLNELTGNIIPAAERAMDIKPLWRGMAGYSLAGLFAVYAAYRCSLFSRIASVSGSMWYDGWLEYARNTPPAARISRAYFSVGAKEKKTRNVRMAAVEENTRAMDALMRGMGIESAFELNPGNHFVDMEMRMGKAIEFLTK